MRTRSISNCSTSLASSDLPSSDLYWQPCSALCCCECASATIGRRMPLCSRPAEQAHAATKLDADAAQAYEIQGICAARAGRPIEARDLLRQSVRREPDNWHFHYVFAVVDANGGNDPRGEALAASSLNPL